MNHQLRTGLSTVPEMDDAQFVRWQSLLEERTGMCLAPQRRSFLQTSLGLRMREVGCDNYQEYYERIVNGASGAIEWSTLVDRLTVQETRFFRDPGEQHRGVRVDVDQNVDSVANRETLTGVQRTHTQGAAGRGERCFFIVEQGDSQVGITLGAGVGDCEVELHSVGIIAEV